MEPKLTLVIGASPVPERYSNLAVRRLLERAYPVVALGKKEGTIGTVPILTGFPKLEHIHTVTLYLSAKNQKPMYDYILGLNPKRIIFNPGAENEELKQMARSKGIEAIEACTLVMLSIGNY
jgi:uncharacterized protein